MAFVGTKAAMVAPKMAPRTEPVSKKTPKWMWVSFRGRRVAVVAIEVAMTDNKLAPTAYRRGTSKPYRRRGTIISPPPSPDIEPNNPAKKEAINRINDSVNILEQVS